MAAKSNPNYTLTGRITNQQDEPLAGLIVHAYDQDPKSADDFLGEPVVTHEDGRYTIRFTEEQLKPGGKESGGPDVYIVVLAGDEQVGRSEVQRNAGREIHIDLQVELPVAEEELSEPTFQVSGVVSQPDGRPLANVVVRAYDQGLRNQRTLSDETRTDADGRYTIGYEQEKLFDPERGSANLLIEVILKEGADSVKSEIRYNARRLETINLTADPVADKSEWERLQGRLQSVLKGIPLEDLKDDELDFVARSSRLKVEALHPVRESARATAATGLPDWFHFALAQQGLPVEGEALRELPEARVLAALQAAQQAKDIPPLSEKELHGVRERFQRLQADHALQKPLAGHRLPAQTLLELAGLPQDAQRQLVRALIGRGPGLDGSISLPDDSGLDEEQLKTARLTLEIARLSDDHTGVVQALRRDPNIQSLRDLARHYDPQHWEELSKAVATKDNSDLPDDLKNNTDNGRATYARRLYARAAAAYPTVATAYGLSRREGLKKAHPAVALLPQIVEADDTFNLGSTRLAPYIEERRGELQLTEESAKAAIDTLKSVQRLYRLKPEMPFIARLLEEPIEVNEKRQTLDSATAIVHVGKGKFVDRYGSDAALRRETAVAVYNAAEKVAARALGVYTRFNPAINTTPLPAAIGDCPVQLKGVPDWPTLFGSLDGCECEPCESVYSPAAYLTDLLAFLERNVEPIKGFVPPDLALKDGLAALAERSYCNADNKLQKKQIRRPDIVQTLLSCRNAETEMPYVDLVLEILERAVAPDGANEVYQTTLPDDQLAVQAEHFNEKAYETLSRKVFPFSLPFDLWHEEANIYLAKLGTSRAELLETFYPFESAADPSVFASGEPHDLTEIRRWQNTAIAQAHLGLSDNAWKLVSGQPIPPADVTLVAPLWGYPVLSGGINWWHPLHNVNTLLTRSGLEYKDLLRLLRLRSFNPAERIRISDASLGACDPKEINLQGLDENALEFLHRFLRLQRALGWSLRGMDQALLALSPPSSSNTRPALAEAFLVRLSHLIRLREKFNLPLDEVLSWWASLDTRNYSVPELPHEQVSPSLYEQLFLSGRPGEAEFEAFQLNIARTELQSNSHLLNSHRPTMAGALRLSLPDLELLVNNLNTALIKNTQGQPQLRLANLSLLFRHASLARALKRKIEDYLTLKKLIGFDPFAVAQLSTNESLGDTLQTLRFIERATAVADSGFSIAELDYLLYQTMSFESKTVAPTEAWVRESLDSLKQEMVTLSVSIPFIGLLNEMLTLLEADPPSEVSLDDLRQLMARALSAFPENANTEGQVYQEVRQRLLHAESLIIANGAFDAATRDEVRDKISEAVEYYTRIQRGLQTSALQTSLAAILELPAPVCRVLLEHTLLPVDPDQMAVDALLSAFLVQEEQIEPEASTAGDGQASGTVADEDDNGTESAEPEAAPQVDQTPLMELLYRLHKAALVIGRLEIQGYELIDENDRPRYLKMIESARWLDIVRLPVRDTDPAASYDAWMRTVRLFHFRDVLPAQQQEHLFDLFALSDKESFTGELHKISNWDKYELASLIGKSAGDEGLLKAVFPTHFRDERLLQRVLTALTFLRRLGVNATAATSWQDGANDRRARVAEIKNALKARYGDGWAEVVKPLRDLLREQQRQALVAYLLHEWNLERADDLFDHFLIDVEMSPCMMTSRLIQAIASVQLFVQRVMMNLEPGLALTQDGAQQWDWMKNYRVWEANRKIFLYPENWIEPELRDDKTPFFKDLENELMQADITNETAETALMHYLEKLHEVARLQICGQYLEKEITDRGEPPIALHVFGRTRDVPHHYYYRRFVFEEGGWTSWERVDVEIEGDHLIPVVFNRRVYLFWPIFTSEDEAPLTHLTQQVIEIFGSVFRIQTNLTRRIGLDAMNAAVDAFIEVIKGIEGVINHIPLFQQRNSDGEIEEFELGTIRSDLNKIKTDLQKGLFPQNTPVPTMSNVFSEVVTLLESFEKHLIKLLPAKRLEVQLAWSEFKSDSWSAKKTSSGVVTFRDVVSTFFESLPDLPGLGSKGVKRLFTFSGEVDPLYNQLKIHCNVALPQSLFSGGPSPDGTQWLSAPKPIGHFRLNGCNGTLETIDPRESLNLVELFSQGLSQILGDAQAIQTQMKNLSADRQLQQRGAPVTPDDDPQRPSTLRKLLQDNHLPRHYFPDYPAPSDDEDFYRILARHQHKNDIDKLEGFFYQDSKRVFLCALEISSGKPAPFVFIPFYHPYTCALLENLQRAGIHGIYQDRYVRSAGGLRLPHSGDTGAQLQVLLDDETFFKREYHPHNMVETIDRALRPIEQFDFSTIGAYAQYNWEIFFHIPLLIANRLSTNQKFREAQHWFHYIFNPTDASQGSVPEKYWRTKPFVERTQAEYTVQDIDQLLLLLNNEGEIPDLQEIERAVRRWRRDAFNPHLVARTRTVAFQKAVVMKYIDNLIAWADSLFRRETRESVNEAMQLYILAAKLLGPRPRRIPRGVKREEKSFDELKPKLDAFSNALVAFENYLPTTASALGVGSIADGGLMIEDTGNLASATLAPVANAYGELIRSPSLRDATRQPGEASLYFCVPPNGKLLDKWNIVADRLFKIRHCQNIEGQALSLALLSPPIDPALLVRAKAMGMDIDGVLSQLQSPLPHYRFQTLAQKASELCGEVKALGSALLSALEKHDGEELALLRTTHELRLLNAVQTIKEQQIKEAKCSLEGLQHSKEATELRRDHNLRLLLEFMNPEEIASTALGAGSLILQIAQFGVTWGASAASLIPNIKAGFVTTLGGTYGGDNLKGAAENAAQAMGILSSIYSSTGGLISTMGGYRRRAEDWLLQIALANKEVQGLEKQICAAEIRVAVAEADLENHKLQIRNSQETQEFMQQKFTNQALYDWMVAQTASLYFQSYQLAYDMARKAQHVFAFELGAEDPGIIRYGYWDSLKRGLLAGEHLHHDLKRLEVAYLDKNRREFELTKNISLSTLDPLALIKLRETGEAEFSLPEALFDMNFPGHYMRRIKSVSLSIPCVTGPYSGVYATLRLEKSRIRCKPEGNDYSPKDDDPRFRTRHTATRVMATSSGQNDSGLFELNFRDERFLPFEGEGVESRWSLSINKEFAQFDLDTISDVVLQVRYTARDGGDGLKSAALKSLREIQDALTTIDDKPLPLTRLFSVRHEFPNEWARFQAQAPTNAQPFELTLDLRKEHYPFWSQGRLNKVEGVDILVRSTEADVKVGNNSLTQESTFGELHIGKLDDNELPTKPVGELKLSFNTAAMSDLWIAMTWSSASPA